MFKNNLEVRIKTLTDYHLEAFISCPYKFYYQYILSKNHSPFHWRQEVQKSINLIIKEYYSLPITKQNKICLLHLIDQNWRNIKMNIFDDQIHYYTVLAKVTDYLLQSLTPKKNPPLFLFEKLHTFVEEIETELSLTFDIGEWSNDAFMIKKYLLDTDESMIKVFQYLITVFSFKAFGVFPEKIEIISLLQGEKFTFYPNEQEFSKGLIYLDFIKDSIKKSEYYWNKESDECSKCHLNKQCNLMNFRDKKSKKSLYHEWH